MTRLVFPSPLLDAVRAEMLMDARETCAALFIHKSGGDRALVRSYKIAPDDAYLERTPERAQLSPAFLVAAVNEARAMKAGIVMTHTHPGTAGRPSFSAVDDKGEQGLLQYFEARLPGREVLALVIGKDGMSARRVGSHDLVAIEAVGAGVSVLSECTTATASAVAAIFDRQVRAFGADGQRLIERLKVAIVGVGGTGSVVAQELAYLGVSKFLLVDPDQIESTNLNRVVGSGTTDLHIPKVDVAARHIQSVNGAAQVAGHVGDVVDDETAELLVAADIIFICTDSHASRAVINQLAYQHLIPAFDMGVGIVAKAGHIESITGRVQMLSPGLPCLVCTGALNSEAVRREMLSPEHRAADPYIQGGGEPQPAVISLNSTVSSLAVTMFLGAVTGLPISARYQSYNALSGSVRPVVARGAPDCIVCSARGVVGRGYSHSLPVRRKSR